MGGIIKIHWQENSLLANTGQSFSQDPPYPKEPKGAGPRGSPPPIRETAREEASASSCVKEEQMYKPAEEEREGREETPFSSLIGGGGGGVTEGLEELIGGVPNELALVLLVGPSVGVGGDMGLLPFEPLEAGVPWGERAGGVFPPFSLSA
ncbi:UNVERIFIED_CONTAM: hypothetical protein Slati_3092100 [Sesamum latifolium]|uniref:Uncharacterized protein n=1 Tax=Sesamum latifolium TaxID=2727402 RepID=A0AAW2UW10_9LAMI